MNLDFLGENGRDTSIYSAQLVPNERFVAFSASPWHFDVKRGRHFQPSPFYGQNLLLFYKLHNLHFLCHRVSHDGEIEAGRELVNFDAALVGDGGL